MEKDRDYWKAHGYEDTEEILKFLLENATFGIDFETFKAKYFSKEKKEEDK